MARTVVEELEHEGGRYLVIGYSPRRPSCLTALTPSELDVVDRYLDGSTVRAIARARRVSERTVENQLAQVYRKLRVGSRAELLARVTGAAERSEDE